MPHVAQLELLAEIDTLVARLARWADEAPPWRPAETCNALVRRLIERTDKLRMRLEAPLVVATFGGTGTGKSALVNALLGDEVSQTGRQRPTTMLPKLICRPGLTPELLGIDPASVEVVHVERPILRELVLVDCPDPDTTEESAEETEGRAERGEGRREKGDAETGRRGEAGSVGSQRTLTPGPSPTSGRGEAGGSAKGFASHNTDKGSASHNTNLERLRAILPHCDVLLVTATQQKYRSAVVEHELAAAAPGARLVFVQTHAEVDDDIRADWRAVLGADDATSIFRVDSLKALADAQAGRPPKGEFAALVNLLSREMAGAAQVRIRRANLLDLAAETLERCRVRLAAALPAVAAVEEAAADQRAKLLKHLAAEMCRELLASRRQWEQRLLERTASRWGFSPFALVLRAYQGLGGLLSGAWLARARSPAQLALWGAVAGVRTWQTRRRQRVADSAAQRAMAGCWDDGELRGATLVLQGYASEAGLPPQCVNTGTVAVEAAAAGATFVDRVAGQLNALVDDLAARHTGFLTRVVYEFLFLGMFGWLLFRLGKNFFYDSWLADQPVAVFGAEAYLASAFWLLLWCVLLLWALTGRLRRGLRRRLDALALDWQQGAADTGLFATLDDTCAEIHRHARRLGELQADIARLQHEVAGL